jgi:hypothetical protein
MASRLGIDPGHFSALYNGKTDIGLDVAVQIHRVFGESLNALCDTNPPAEFYPPGTRPGIFLNAPEPQPPGPRSASSATAQSGKRRHGGSGTT